jgi:hypothetical protein
MQEARGSNPLSSTFPQVKRILRSSEMTFECLQPSKSPIVYDLPPLKSMQVRMMLCCGDTAVAPSSLSGSQTDCQSVIQSAVFCPSGQLPGAAVLRYVRSTWTISRVGWWRYSCRFRATDYCRSGAGQRSHNKRLGAHRLWCWSRLGTGRAGCGRVPMARIRRSRRCLSGAGRLSIRLAGAQEVGQVSGVNACTRLGRPVDAVRAVRWA